MNKKIPYRIVIGQREIGYQCSNCQTLWTDYVWNMFPASKFICTKDMNGRKGCGRKLSTGVLKSSVGIREFEWKDGYIKQ